MESSICNAHLVEEAYNFCSHYFEPQVYTRMRKVPRNDDGGDGDEIEGTLPIFKHPGRPYGRSKSRRLSYSEYEVARTYVVRPEKFRFLEKGQIVISIKNPEFIL